jgi:hypothetical protein
MAIDIRDRCKKLAAEIRDELRKLDLLYAEWQGVDSDSGSRSLIMRGKASMFHDFYCGSNL